MKRIVSRFDWPGSQEDLTAKIAAFHAAKLAHVSTVDIPAPREEEIIERCHHHFCAGDEIVSENALPPEEKITPPKPLTPEEHAEDHAKKQAAYIAAMNPARRRMHEYAAAGIIGHGMTLAILSDDKEAIAAARAKKAEIDAKFPLENDGQVKSALGAVKKLRRRFWPWGNHA